MSRAEELKAIAEPTRYKIVQLLLDRHHCSRSLALTLGISESAVSQHMAVLKSLGLVHGYRHGYHVHYELDKERFQGLVDELASWVVRMQDTVRCHGIDSCAYRLDDGSDGCLYKS